MRPSVMPRHPNPAPDPPQPIPATVTELRPNVDHADFAELAARFGAHGGGRLLPELCGELALEIVLNDIVEKACLTTGATGAAIVLQRDGEMVCRARSGEMAPDLGARLDGTSGLSGECLRTHQTQSCDDVLIDPRADLEASQRLGARSVIVIPLLRGAELVGVFELFSSQPYAFGERDRRNLKALAERILGNLARAAEYRQRLESGEREHKEREQLEVSPVPQARLDTLDSYEISSRRRFDPVTWAFGAALLACALWLGLIVARNLGLQKAHLRRHSPVATAAAGSVSAIAPAISGASPPGVGTRLSTGPSSAQPSSTQPLTMQPSSAKLSAEPPAPPGSLQVFENGKEIYRLPPGAAPSSTRQGSGTQRDAILLRRVEPEYPEDARRAKVQGVVVLEVRVGADGTVEDVRAVSGPLQLVQASTDAVKQWRFKTHLENGRAVEMQSRVSLNFRLPE